MLELHPFTGHVVAQDRARRVVAPPYDALAPQARAALAATDPDSYLGALPTGTVAEAGGAFEVALARCRSHLDRLLTTGRYRPLPGPTIGMLRFAAAGAVPAVAIVGDVPVTAFAAVDATPAAVPARRQPPAHLVRPHERVDAARVAQLTRYLEVVGVASSPVALTQRPHPDVTAAADAVTAGTPDVAYRAADGVDVALWCVSDRDRREALAAAVARAGPAYLADGHHRSAAARHHARRSGSDPADPAGRVLCAVIPSDHLTVSPFHRRLDDVLPPGAGDGDAEVAAMLDRLRTAGVRVAPLDQPVLPTAQRRVTLTAAGDWWDLDIAALARAAGHGTGADDTVPHGSSADDTGAAGLVLDAALVDHHLTRLLVPDATRPVRAVPVPAPLGLDALVRSGAVGVGLSPPTIETVLAVAEAGGTLPPKTTYVLPKLRSGLLVTPRGTDLLRRAT